MGPIIVVFMGQYDLTHKAQLRKDFDALRDEPNLVLDMSAVTYLDSTCVSELMRLHDLRSRKGYERFALVRNPVLFRRLFEILNMGNLFRIVDALDDVLAKDGNPAAVRYAAPGNEQLNSSRLVETAAV
jgi:anti-anti-sigma factor